jgi:adenylate kinase family enzyme
MSKELLFCIFIRGLPGVGKTSLAKAVSAVHRATILNPDDLSQSNNLGDLKTARLKVLKYRFLLDRCIEELKNGKNIIWEQPWRKTKNIQITVDNIKKATQRSNFPAKFLVVEICTDKNISWDRSKNKFKTLDHFEKYINKYQKYNLKLPYLPLSGSENTAELVNSITKLLKTLDRGKTPFSKV